MEKINNLKVSNFKDAKFYKILENCVQYGQPFLIENFELEMDPLMNPILLK